MIGNIPPLNKRKWPHAIVEQTKESDISSAGIIPKATWNELHFVVNIVY